MQGCLKLRPAPNAAAVLTRRPHRLPTTQAFRSDDVNAARSASTARLQPQTRLTGSSESDAALPLWKKPSFPGVVAIALATLPYDLAYHHMQPRHSTSRRSATSSSTSAAPRHAKPTGRSQRNPAVAAAAPRDISAVKREAAAAAAAAAAADQGSQRQRPQHSQAAGSSQARGPPSTQQSSELWPLAAVGAGAMGVPAGPVDSWDASDAGGGGFSDEEAEQQAKAMVIELLTHPKDTEEALMRAAAAGPGSMDSSGGRPVSVSPEYIDGLVHAIQDPSMGMPHHQPAAPVEPPKSSTLSNSSGSLGEPGTEEATASSSSSSERRRRQPSNATLWSWMDASPRSYDDEDESQEEF